MTLAFKTALPCTQKFVLVALCDSANDQGECYPSVPTLAEKCSLSERAVQTSIATLEGLGYVRREFRKGRSTTYWLSTTPAPAAPHPRTTFTPAPAAPVNDVHHTPAAPAPGGAPAAPPPPQELHHTPAAPAPRTIKESSVEPSKEPSGKHQPLDVSDAVWSDFGRLRTAKKAPITATAVAGIRREADKAGWSMQAALEQCCERGWTGFKADWVQQQSAGGRGLNRQEALEQRNRTVADVWAAQERAFDGAK